MDTPTTRSLVLGLALGVIPIASNLYLGLKTGWGFGSEFFAILLGFPLLRFADRTFNGADHASSVTLQEHGLLVTVSVAVSNLTMSGYVNGIPALYKLGLLDPAAYPLDMARLVVWGTTVALVACFVALVMAPWFLKRRDLPFPSSVGAAHLLRQLHANAAASTVEGGAVVEGKVIPPLDDEKVARKRRESEVQQRTMVQCIVGSFLFLMVAFAIPAIKEYHLFWWLAGAPPRTGPHPSVGLAAIFFNMDRFHLFFSVSFAFFGAGMMMGVRTTTSFFFGSFLAWYAIGHWLVERSGWVPNPYDPRSRRYSSPTSMDPSSPGVAYWLLWPGITILVTHAATDLVLNAAAYLIARVRGTASASRASSTAAVPDPNDLKAPPVVNAVHGSHDVSGFAGRQVRVLKYVAAPMAVALCAIMTQATFRLSLGVAGLAIALGVVLTYIATLASAVTDMNPSGTLAKVAKGVLAMVPATSLAQRQVTTVAGAMVAAGLSSQTVDLVSSFKLGQLCQMNVLAQVRTQLLGATLAAPLTALVFSLYVHAYPCILAERDDDCATQHGFSLTAANTWKVFAIAMADGPAAIAARVPPSALAACGVAAAAVVVTGVIRRVLLQPRGYAWIVPQWNAIGVAMLNPRTDYAFAAWLGALVSVVWQRQAPHAHDKLLFTVASGFIAGEGLWGLVAAVMNIVGLSNGWLTRAGLP
ncbi:hypothetical protein GGF31_004263 [Allomyces arbusculus]|nr:hypothetical protein GGF31_004263 [Allomyces arbusculus]